MKTITHFLLCLFLLSISSYSQGNFWQQGGENIYNTNIGKVGINTDDPSGRLSVNGDLHLYDQSNSNVKLILGYFHYHSLDYAAINAYDLSAGTGKNLVLNSTPSDVPSAYVGIGPLNPIQTLDINGRLNLRLGVIQNGTTPISNSSDLGLYSQLSGYHMRFVTNNAPIRFFTDAGTNLIGGTSTMVIHNNGSVGIGTESPDVNYKLSVNGGIRCKSVRVETYWSDFVFRADYKLRTLSEVEAYVKENGHLPEIPSETEVSANGVELGDMTSKLLQKVEELTLYIIEQQKEIEKLKAGYEVERTGEK